MQYYGMLSFSVDVERGFSLYLALVCEFFGIHDLSLFSTCSLGTLSHDR